MAADAVAVRLACSQTTYEDLKRGLPYSGGQGLACSQTTYEDLKPFEEEVYEAPDGVRRLPTRI